MQFDADQLRALAAIAASGSLDGAARTLHVTPSAVSQRLRALESATGQVLVVRSRPARMTAAGELLVRLATQLQQLERETARELRGGRGEQARPRLEVAVNADSLATWFLPAVAPLAETVELRLHREDERQTGELLRRGVVMAALTGDPEPVAGCHASAIGTMRYVPVAAPEFAERWFGGGRAGDGRAGGGSSSRGPSGGDAFAAALHEAPIVDFDAADELQDRFVARLTGAAPTGAPRHRIPATADHLRAIELGFGWGLLPQLHPAVAERSARLTAISDERLDVPLYWQRWTLRTEPLMRLTELVLAAARDRLVR